MLKDELKEVSVRNNADYEQSGSTDILDSLPNTGWAGKFSSTVNFLKKMPTNIKKAYTGVSEFVHKFVSLDSNDEEDDDSGIDTNQDSNDDMNSIHLDLGDSLEDSRAMGNLQYFALYNEESVRAVLAHRDILINELIKKPLLTYSDVSPEDREDAISFLVDACKEADEAFLELGRRRQEKREESLVEYLKLIKDRGQLRYECFGVDKAKSLEYDTSEGVKSPLYVARRNNLQNYIKDKSVSDEVMCIFEQAKPAYECPFQICKIFLEKCKNNHKLKRYTSSLLASYVYYVMGTFMQMNLPQRSPMSIAKEILRKNNIKYDD